MLNFFKKKKPAIVVVTLNARLQPTHRAELEDVFEDVMAKEKLSARIVGGGTSMAANGEVSSCDMEVEFDDASLDNINFAIRILSSMLGPKGSYFISSIDNKKVEFGSHEGLALYLNGTELPDEVYASNDSNDVYEECERLIKGIGMINSHWQGPTESAMYMYGKSFEEMHSKIAQYLENYPLCQKCRVEKIA